MNFAGFLSMWIFATFLTVCVKCAFSWTGIPSTIYSKLYNVVEYIPCKFAECCNDEYVSPDINMLDDILNTELYGQEIAHHIVVNALRGHLGSSNPPKALAMSFHGPPGTGKTYVAQMIATSFYKKGDHSKFYHFFNGRNDFPLERDIEHYKCVVLLCIIQEELRKTIMDSLIKCERSIFVFDEVDKMPEGLLNVLVPFLDYTTWFKSWRLMGATVNTRKAIYIFLSNTGSSKITQRLLTLWAEGKHRHGTKLQDFENLISVGAFNEKGGLYRSEAIDTSLIDHYVPFLPLEEAHVKMCLRKAFLKRDSTPTNDMIEEVMSYVVFGPPPHNLYATAGCKRLEQKVASIIYARRKKLLNKEL
ncbi:torsin-1A-like isoform X1 [Hylaeus volcanicus]|uniref:torsin-1A-like isoform X1 n=1 Tax=Hylaeus volcanicus TaxID=313075 RepID=UPI0023B81B2F|nr:torsin-1A-like isoform X1 [Hylaeus volcanicus]